MKLTATFMNRFSSAVETSEKGETKVYSCHLTFFTGQGCCWCFMGIVKSFNKPLYTLMVTSPTNFLWTKESGHLDQSRNLLWPFDRVCRSWITRDNNFVSWKQINAKRGVICSIPVNDLSKSKVCTTSSTAQSTSLGRMYFLSGILLLSLSGIIV